METLLIDIINPKAKAILKDLADLKLIKIKKEKRKTELVQLLDKLRINSDETPSVDEITKEVENVRKERYENH